MTNPSDPRTIAQGSDRWLTDSRVYNLVWLGRWIERSHTIARVVRWAAMQDAASGKWRMLYQGRNPGMAADIRGVSVEPYATALDLLLMRDGSASLRGCLVAARFNATHVAPVEILQILGEAVEMVEGEGPAISSADDVAGLMNRVLPTLDRLHTAIEQAWFHSTPMLEEEVYRRFVQQQQ